MILFLIGLFCFLLVIGFFATKGQASLAFAGTSMIVLVAICFVGFLGLVVYAFLKG
jgi:hypothetical protein